MVTTPTEYKHVVLDPSGQALIEGTTMKVRELIVEHLAYGWSPEEVQWQHPYLSMAHIHAAFTYYYDHQAQMDEEIRAARIWAEQMRDKSKDTAFVRRKLKKLGLL